MDSSFYSSSLTIEAINSFHAGERNLYSRLAFNLDIDPFCSLHLIAFWLWLEEDGHHDNLINLTSYMTDNSLRSAAHMALSFLAALQANTNPIPTALREKVMNGIDYYIFNVCYKALTDLHKKAIMKKLIVQNLSCTCLSEVYEFPFMPLSECSSDNEELHLLDRIIYEKSDMIGLKGEVKPQMYYFYANQSNIEICKHGGRHSNIPRDERMLFVTFSNGYPLTEEELCSFFIRNFGDVEMVSIEQVGGRRQQQPLFAYVSFYSFSTVVAILNGNYKVKFFINGKHLWARRFIPKRKHQ